MEIKNNDKCMNELANLIDLFHNPMLTNEQKDLYKKYFHLLVQENDLYNLTAITQPEKIASHHLEDSLAILSFLDLKTIHGFVDVGSGAGFPGIPIKIYAPDVPMVLIEVSTKKIAFLEKVVYELNLKNVLIYPHDWRTFLRKTKFDGTVFLSRASLHPKELLRMFQPNSFYQNALLVYYASDKWRPTKEEENYIDKRVTYMIENKIRTFVFFKNSKKEI